jgi:hypothetical protein
VNLYLTFTWRALVRGTSTQVSKNSNASGRTTGTGAPVGSLFGDDFLLTGAASDTPTGKVQSSAAGTGVAAADNATQNASNDPAPVNGPLIGGSVAVTVGPSPPQFAAGKYVVAESKTSAPTAATTPIAGVVSPTANSGVGSVSAAAALATRQHAASDAMINANGSAEANGTGPRLPPHRVKQVARAALLRRYTSNGWTLLICLAFFMIGLIVTLIVHWTVRDAVYDNPRNTGTGMTDSARTASAVITSVYCALILIAAYLLRYVV